MQIERSSTLRLGAFALAGMVALAACDDSPTDPPAGPEPAEVEIAPDAVTLDAVGATEPLEVTVLDEEGDEIEDPDVDWSSSDEDVATVDEDGLVEATGEGTATITATSGEASGEATVTVEIDDA